MNRLINSRIGRAWVAIREDDIAAESMGIDTFRLKLLAFVTGSAWAGLAGVFFAAKMAFVSPESFTFSESVMILCMVVLGGMGSIPGIILGALLLITLPEIFRDFQDYRMLAFGAALVLMMIFRPQGLVGHRKNGLKSLMFVNTIMLLLETKNLSKHFGGLKAVDGIDMRLERERIVSIIGPNGAGKTLFSTA